MTALPMHFSWLFLNKTHLKVCLEAQKLARSHFMLTPTIKYIFVTHDSKMCFTYVN